MPARAGRRRRCRWPGPARRREAAAATRLPVPGWSIGRGSRPGRTPGRRAQMPGPAGEPAARRLSGSVPRTGPLGPARTVRAASSTRPGPSVQAKLIATSRSSPGSHSIRSGPQAGPATVATSVERAGCGQAGGCPADIDHRWIERLRSGQYAHRDGVGCAPFDAAAASGRDLGVGHNGRARGCGGLTGPLVQERLGGQRRRPRSSWGVSWPGQPGLQSVHDPAPVGVAAQDEPSRRPGVGAGEL